MKGDDAFLKTIYRNLIMEKINIKSFIKKKKILYSWINGKAFLKKYIQKNHFQ